eukprot:1347689-Alexandrium_andersonii.AAC.1
MTKCAGELHWRYNMLRRLSGVCCIVIKTMCAQCAMQACVCCRAGGSKHVCTEACGACVRACVRRLLFFQRSGIFARPPK